MHCYPIAPPHLPHFIPPPNRPTHTCSSGEQGRRPTPTASSIPCKSTPAPTATLTPVLPAMRKSRTCAACTRVLDVPASSHVMWLLSGRRSTCSATVKEGVCTSWLSTFSNMGECRARGSAVVVWERAHKACIDCVLGSMARVGRSVLAMVLTQALCMAWCMCQPTSSSAQSTRHCVMLPRTSSMLSSLRAMAVRTDA